MTNFEPATRRTRYFIGVTTGLSSIMQVFPAWAKVLKTDVAVQHDVSLRARLWPGP